jgi:hypothetical protein
MGLSLSACTSAMYDYTLDEPAACHHLIPNKARNNLHNLLHHQPWKEAFSLDFGLADGFAASEVESARDQIELLPEGSVEYMESASLSAADRCLLASQLAGLTWEAEFWKVAKTVLEKEQIKGSVFTTDN